MLRDHLLDGRNLDLRRRCFYEVLQHFIGHFQRNLLAVYAGVDYQLDQAALELPDVALDGVGDEREDVVVDCHVFVVDFLLENSQPRLVVGGLNIGNEPPLEPRNQALFLET